MNRFACQFKKEREVVHQYHFYGSLIPRVPDELKRKKEK